MFCPINRWAYTYVGVFFQTGHKNKHAAERVDVTKTFQVTYMKPEEKV